MVIILTYIRGTQKKSNSGQGERPPKASGAKSTGGNRTQKRTVGLCNILNHCNRHGRQTLKENLPTHKQKLNSLIDEQHTKNLLFG
jgi:hypothetical protein